GIDIVKVNVGDEAIDACIDAGRLVSVHVALGRYKIGQNLKICYPARAGGVGGVTADALEIIALEIELLRLAQSGLCEARLLQKQCLAECGPEPLVLPA